MYGPTTNNSTGNTLNPQHHGGYATHFRNAQEQVILQQAINRNLQHIQQKSSIQKHLLHNIPGQKIVNQSYLQINPNKKENSEVPQIIADENAPAQPGPSFPTAHVIKSILKYLVQDTGPSLWNYEDITSRGMSLLQLMLIQKACSFTNFVFVRLTL